MTVCSDTVKDTRPAQEAYAMTAFRMSFGW